jgi:hypothetical protein
MREIPDNNGLLEESRGYKSHFYLKNGGCFFDENTKKQG